MDDRREKGQWLRVLVVLRHRHRPQFPSSVFVALVESTVHGVTTSMDQAQEWVKALVSVHGPLAASITAAVVTVPHEHSWRVEGDDNYEPYINVCETCGEREPDPFETALSGRTARS